MNDNVTDVILPILQKIQNDIAGMREDSNSQFAGMRIQFAQVRDSIGKLERGQDMLAKEVVSIRDDIRQLRSEILDYKELNRRVKRIEEHLTLEP